MAPKTKGSKGGDDWDEGLGEVADPIAAATQAAKDEEAAGDAEEGDNTGGGGLLAALKKNRGKKQKKGKAVADLDDQDEDGDATGPVDLASKAPVEASMDDEDLYSQPKKGKGGKAGGKYQKAEPADDDEDDQPGGKMKSKKEKEKEKKEREKQRKKEQAAKKKTAGPIRTPAPQPAKAEEAKPEPSATPDVAAGGKKKKVPAALAALQKQQEERRLREEQLARLEAEEKTKEIERMRLEEEENKRKEEQKAAKKAKERAKIEQLKKEGKFMTKAQKEAAERNKIRMQQMLESGGAKVLGLEAGAEKKKPVYDNRKRKGGKKGVQEKKEEPVDETAKQLEETHIEEPVQEPEPVEPEEEDAGLEDWETEAAKLEGVKDSWDASSEEEEELKPGARGKAAAANGKALAEESSEESSEEETEDEEKPSVAAKVVSARKAEAEERRKKKHEEALAARSASNLRSPICCILGHVDTGKTKLLDKVRQTNVQEGEAGGITQQIGATYFPVEALQKKTAVVNQDGKFEFKVPGLLVIDTPGHESFTNLRSRGSSLCNIAILVVDIMHGLEPQTLESMKLLRERKTPFIVALNKIDRLFGWKQIANNGFQNSLSMQNKGCQGEFRDRLEKTKLAFAEQGFNSELFYENRFMARNVSLVPTSAHTGEGIPDLLKLLVNLSQERMTNSLMYLSEVEATVLEVKVIEGLGTTIDVILSNGVLREGDRIVLCGLNGAITTNIRALLTPAEMKELRVKSQYVHNKEIKAAMGIKISADGLDSAIAGSRLLVVGEDDDEEDLEEEVMSDLENLLSRISKTGKGVSVQASTLGSLEALLEFLRVSKIPVANISIGPVYKRDVMQAGVMLERAPEYAVMLCFDVRVDKEAEKYAADVGVKIFTADIIYHLFDDFTNHLKQLAEQRKEESKMLAVFPCVLKPVAVFNNKDPIVVGVDVIDGTLKMHTPICAIKTNAEGKKEIIDMGRVTSIERDHKALPICKKGQPSVAVKIEGPNQPLYGRQLEEKDILYSKISRTTIDTLKEFYKEDVSMDEWHLLKKLKPLFDIS
ncbi:hypothetical protein P152DRAFT_459236 [Eremomyces bilateralis CBS 781.70]|uniref:Eukaryotic translation initiation factor 5B n=1 Tax=Eremomyces bilateralis CBS 781.70 TaxID=1392243 RepID=A0A6G1G0Y9_9PEZI|nr:uncharacterized protein P152DRAFT_459236 [Eremomyces bilateralis CBS 781.70]KAF1811775.1 hypothetical protein P152DRAFT_459236 [Eremomyces bilateralis CBS 781.70]